MKSLKRLFTDKVIIVELVILAILLAITMPVGGNWTVDSAVEELNDAGYIITDPHGTILVEDVLPNADSTWDIGALGNEFAELYIDAWYLNGHEIAISGMSDFFMDCLVVTANHVRAAEDLSAAIPLTFTIDLQTDVPRTLSFDFVAHAQITDYTIELTGLNSKGDLNTETFTQAADGWNFESDWAYAVINSIIMTERTGTGAGDTMNVGITDHVGLSNNINLVTDVYKITKNNADEPVVGGDVDVTYDTYDLNTAVIGAADDFAIWYDGNISFID